MIFLLHEKLITWHIFPFLLCFWYTGSYILQPFPACAIAALVITGFTYIAFRNPAHGAIAAVFCMPLTLSLGRHLIAYLGESAPVYLPYAEMILIATLWGWVWRAILHQYHPERFPIIQQEKTGFEQFHPGGYGSMGVTDGAGSVSRTVPHLPVHLPSHGNWLR